MKNSTENVDPIDGFDLCKFRAAVAKPVKLMIRARAKLEPGFLSREQYLRWNLHDIADDPYTTESLLRQAEAAHDHLWRVFIGPNGSGGVAADDPQAEFKQSVVSFTTGTHPADLRKRLSSGEEIDWGAAAEWNLLSLLRDGLDSLPQIKLADEGANRGCPVVIINSSKREVEVLGQLYRLTQTRMNVIQALMQAYPSTLTKDLLVGRSGHPDAVNVLKRLSDKEPWGSVIRLAGQPGRGYGLIRPSADDTATS